MLKLPIFVKADRGMDISSEPFALYSWPSIWSSFVQSQRARTWLFSDEPPPTDQIYHAFKNRPTLLGFDFYPLDRTNNNSLASKCPYPDIGDLATVYTFHDDILLGFNFGNGAVQPFIPPLYGVTNKPVMNNAKTIVRRTARRFVNISNVRCFLTIEFSWFETGSLAISTCINPICCEETLNVDSRDDQYTPFLDHVELRFFLPTAVTRLKNLAQMCNLTPSYHPLPLEFLDPCEEHYVIRIRQPPFSCSLDKHDISTYTSDLPAPKVSDFISPSFYNKWVEHGSSNYSMSVAGVTHTGQVLDTNHLMDKCCVQVKLSKDKSQINEAQHMDIWHVYQNTVTSARRKGVYMSIMGHRVYTPNYMEHQLFSRYGRYQFLCTSVTVHDRIQQLCQQLGIPLTSPKADTPLLECEKVGTQKTEKNHYKLESKAQSVPRTNTYSKHKELCASEIHEVVSCHCGSSCTSDGSCGTTTTAVSWATDVTLGSNSQEELQTKNRDVSSKWDLEHETKCPYQRDVERPVQLSNITPSKGNSGVDKEEKVKVELLYARHLTNTNPGLTYEVKEFATNPKTPKHVEPGIVGNGERSDKDFGNAKNEKNNKLDRALGDTKRKYAPTSTKSDEEHVRKWSKMVWTCEQCGAQIRGKRGNLNRHIASKHDNVRAFECQVQSCRRRFQTRLNMLRHVGAVHDGRPHGCEKCSRAFKSKKDLESHFHTSHLQSANELFCSICGGCFGRRSTLIRHITNVHTDHELK